MAAHLVTSKGGNVKSAFVFYYLIQLGRLSLQKGIQHSSSVIGNKHR